MSLTLLSLIIEFNTGNYAGFQLEPLLDPPNGNQDRLCLTVEFVTKQTSLRITERTNSRCCFPKVLENIRPGVVNTLSLAIDRKIKDPKEKKCIRVAEILRNVCGFVNDPLLIKMTKEA